MWIDSIEEVHQGTANDRPHRLKSLGALDSSYLAFLKRNNGGYALGRALHIYGHATANDFDDIDWRNSTMRELYGDACSESLFFAEDVFGNQYGFARGRVGVFNVETGDWKDLANTFRAWVEVVESETDYYSGYSLRHQWEALHGPIPYGSLLCPRTPFVLGGDYKVENLVAMPWLELLNFLRQVFLQVRDLPDGTSFELREGEPPTGLPQP